MPRYADVITSLSEAQLENPIDQPSLLIEDVFSDRPLRLVYAPFDYVNSDAGIAIVGLTPGLRQAVDALKACRRALLAGASFEDALFKAKGVASFSGPMRQNLVAMLDAIGLPSFLGIETCESLWTTDHCMVNFTSAIRYPLFSGGANWSGTPDILKNGHIRGWLENYGASEFRELRQVLYVPLGGAVTRALQHLADRGHLDRRAILDGMPHPSGANAERVACFLGRKSPALASSKTDGHGLVAAHRALTERISQLVAAPLGKVG